MNGIDYKLVAKRLKELREEIGKSARQVAREIGVGESCIAQWERLHRTPTIDGIFRLAKHYNVSSDYLLGLVD